ncbi:MAG: guanylate kinase [Bacilli bacterium]|jgi:guanylate kinase|nr:guanylate kinase [Bacilli bacterium]
MNIIKTKNKGLLIVVSGPSGAGKGTINGELLKRNNNIWMSTSMTTREPRGNEQNGKEYFFVTKEEFEERIKNNQFLEYAVVHSGKYYGTPKDKIYDKLNSGIDVILEIDIQGALEIQQKISDALFIFIMPPSMRILKERLTNRGTESEEKVLERFKTAYKEINEFTKYNYVVVNDEVEKAVEKVEAIIKAEKCRVDRIEEVFLNNPEEKVHESLVDKDLIN